MGQRQGFDLEMEISQRQQRDEWVMQRVATPLLWILLLAIALGLLGRGGPLSAVDVSVENGTARMRYNRFLRNHSPDELRVTTQARSNEVRLRLPSDYLERIEMTQVTPQPERVIAEDGAVAFVFLARPGAELHAEFQFAPDRLGPLKGWVQVDALPRRPFDQFVYP